VFVVASAMVMKPPARPAWSPEKESSKTKEAAGSPPPRAQALRKTSGSGLPRVTSSLATAPAKKLADAEELEGEGEVLLVGGGPDDAGDAEVPERPAELADAGQQADVPGAGDVAVEGFLAVRQALHLRGLARPAEDVGDDQLVALAEAVA